MKLDRFVVRLSILGIALTLVLPFVWDQVQAFGNASDRDAFAPKAENVTDTTLVANIGAKPTLVLDEDDGPTVAAAPSPTRPAPRRATAPSTATATAPADRSTVDDIASPETWAEVVFEGTVAGNRKAKPPKWTATEYRAKASGEHEFTLEWSGNGKLMFSMKTANGTWMAADTSADKPKSFTVDLDKGKSYRVAVWSKAGRGKFVVSTTGANGGAQGDDSVPPPPEEQPPPPEDAPPPPTGSGFPGKPSNGSLLWGASITGNGDPTARHEIPAGHNLALRRTYYRWDQRTGSLIRTAKDDHANGRLPWVSVKTPSWIEMGRGDHDAAIDEMLRAIDALNGPVWLTVHHEPEGGGGRNSPDDPGGPSAHVDMNRRVRERMTALGTDNIALAPILMSWSWNPKSGRNPNEWWAAGIYDFVGVDHYRDSEDSLLTSTWFDVRAWAADRGVPVAIGEWGMRGTDAAAGQRVHEWYDHAAGSAGDGRGARVVGISAFDSSLNSPTGSWELKGKQLEAFHDLLNDSRTHDAL